MVVQFHSWFYSILLLLGALQILYISYIVYIHENWQKTRRKRWRNAVVSVLTVWHSEHAARCRGGERRWETTKYRAWLIAAPLMPYAGKAGT